ncbi:hypothetical protein ONE63_002306 [Megalurothrips usitatus]|uniref:Branchpoint-bridging protein n=1 Tax=Megalurothrips usitatus TaxID=439358 RepID=A0AAV7X8H7_9NEOP|nr:hypothetical protein ONE63_002306 [Megalurothrips usitatus]
MKRENESAESREERRKKRKSRWGNDEKEKIFIPGMPTVLPTNLTKEQEEAYLVQLQIEEVSRKLRTGELGIATNPEERSPSPEPIYSSDGKRLNTREYRTRKKLEDERHHLVTKMIELNPEFKPPPDYKPPVVRVSDKVMIPQDEHPDINFVGLLIGPRGNTLKSMERETGAKIIIRGKGSVKEGKVGRKDGQPLPGEDEPLHAYVTASQPESVKKAVDRIKEIIRQGVEVPEGQNDLRRMQLRELALLNGTLRENDGPRCTNCGATDHKSWMCPDKPNVTNNIVCSACGGVGHIARDCRQKRAGSEGGRSTNQDKAKIDEEYMSLMAELGEGPPPSREKESSYRRNNNSSSSAALFERQMQPRPIMAPPPPAVMQTPPQLIPSSLPPPPWSTHAHMQPDKVAVPQPAPPPGVMPNLNRPPPPATSGMAVPPPWQMASVPQVAQVPQVPPPNILQAPPPPPPAPGTQSPQSPSIPPLLPWLASSQPPPPATTQTMNRPPPTNVPPPGIPPWQQQPPGPPPARPPPPPAAQAGMSSMYPWQSGGFMGVPPPQPVQPPPAINNLPNLLAAPPPPPPS